MSPKNWSSDQGGRSFVEDARRAQIVEAAIETLAELGYARASLARIAARAGIAQGLISYHFRNKRDLMERVVATVDEEMTEMVESRADGGGSHRDQVRALIAGFVRYCADRPARIVAVGQIESAEGWAASARERSIDDIERLLRAGQRTGEFRSFSSRVMAVTLLAALEAVPVEMRASPDTDADTYTSELTAVFDPALREAER